MTRPRVLVVAALAAFAFGSAVRIATAAHFHTYNFTPHGVVHGDYTTDGSFFGRTEFSYLSVSYYCSVGEAGGAGTYYGGWVYNDTCSLWSRRYHSNPDECLARAYNAVNGDVLGYHDHYAHNYNGFGCRPNWT